jgi:hypothetical protein
VAQVCLPQSTPLGRNQEKKGLNEPATAGGRLIAPGLSPGFERHPRPLSPRLGTSLLSMSFQNAIASPVMA